MLKENGQAAHAVQAHEWWLTCPSYIPVFPGEKEVRSVDTPYLYLKLGFCLFSRKSHEGVALLSGQ